MIGSCRAAVGLVVSVLLPTTPTALVTGMTVPDEVDAPGAADRPTVVLEAGSGGFAAGMAWLHRDLAEPGRGLRPCRLRLQRCG